MNCTKYPFKIYTVSVPLFLGLCIVNKVIIYSTRKMRPTCKHISDDTNSLSFLLMVILQLYRHRNVFLFKHLEMNESSNG